jgi:ATP-binding cassette subfamily B protein RaxB
MTLDLRLLGARRIPFVGASENNECGLACLAAVSEYLRGDLGLVEIRELARPSGRGETLLEIRDLAEQIGLNARGVRVELSGLKLINKPAILHWDMNHCEEETQFANQLVDIVKNRYPTANVEPQKVYCYPYECP